MALAYLLLCHHSPDYIEALVRHIWRPEHVYLLHADRKALPAVPAALARLAEHHPNARVLPPVLCSWGGWSLVETMLQGISAALASPGWRHLLLLSENHLPLRAPEDAVAALQPGVSYLDAVPVSGMDPRARDDVGHRFAARHRELPGLGMFPQSPRALPAGFAARLHHGSQWVALARDACERLAALPAAHPVWGPFRTALLPDETALQTVLRGTEHGAGLAFAQRNMTYVAWPHLSGNDDMSFTEPNFFAARDAGHLFIRKRPAVLSEAVAAVLAAMQPAPALPPLPMPATAGGAAPAGALAVALLQALQSRVPAPEMMAFPGGHPGAAQTCCLQVRCAGLPPRLYVGVVSEDLRHFKVSLVWTSAPGDSLRLGTLGGYPTTVLKVRLPQMFLAREVLLPDMPGGGFAEPDPEQRVAMLADLAARALAAGLRLAPALAA